MGKRSGKKFNTYIQDSTPNIQQHQDQSSITGHRPQQVRVMNNNNKDNCRLRLILPTVNTDVLALTKGRVEEGQEGDRQNLSSRICQIPGFSFNSFMTFQHPGLFLNEFYSPICEVVFT